MKLEELKSHPDNNRIYSPTDLQELKNSLESFGQLEPVAITKDKKIISGHRRVMAMEELGWEEVEVRIVEPENEVISVIEHNRHRQKTSSDILNEAKFLERELRNLVGRGRNASKEREGKNKCQRLKMVMELSQRLGVGATRLKQLLSISNYEPELIEKIDRGEMSVSKAYDLVREKHINKNKKNPESIFRSSMQKLLKENQPKLNDVMDTLKQTYPYSLELTGVSEDRRMELIELTALRFLGLTF